MIVPPSLPVPARPAHCPTAAHHRLAWAADGSNAATCVLPAAPEKGSGHHGPAENAVQAAARCCRHVVWSWHAPLDGLSTGHWAHRSTTPQPGSMPSMAAWLAERAAKAGDTGARVVTRSRLSLRCLAVLLSLLVLVLVPTLLTPLPARADTGSYAAGDGADSVPALLADAADDYGVSYGLLARISWCESRWNPYAVNRWSGAAGVFQWMPASWQWASVQAGYAGASRFDAEANVRTAAWLLAQPGGTRHWRSCL